MEPAEELICTLEKELDLGEELRTNLAAQAQAFLCWDIWRLVQELENKELLLFKLRQVTAERGGVVERICGSGKSQHVSLSHVIAGLSSELRQARLRKVQKKLTATYRCLQTEEAVLLGLIGDLLGHFKQALRTFVEPAVHLYGSKGDLTVSGAELGLIHGKV
ncbi:MAG: flagellar export chaperone FlgN [Deltaproteobacteria bacterium]|nr:flagellar export chaperone FlgN [Deltaproteobacteria bacterium]